MPTDHDNDGEDLRDTLPPSPATEPPPAFNPPPSAALKQLAGYDPDQFLHAALVAAADGAHERREERKAQERQTADLAAALKAAVDDLDAKAETRSAARTKEIKADFELTNTEVRKLATSVGQLEATVRELLPRTKDNEDGLRALRVELGQVKERLKHLESEITRLASKT